jgi:hypothetical protein
MVPAGVTLAPNGDLLIAESSADTGVPERIRPVASGAPVSGFNFRDLHRLDVFVLAGGPSQSGGVFTVYFPDGTTALFIDGRFLTDPPTAPMEVPRATLLSEIDNGATLLIPLDPNWDGVSAFVVEDLFDLSEEDRASLTPVYLIPERAEPARPADGLEALPSGLLLRR